MKKIEKTEGIVLKVQDYKENAVICYVLTNNGLLSLIVKGAKKITASTSKIAVPLTKIAFNHTESSSLSTLTEGIILDNYSLIKNDYERYNLALIIIEKLYHFSEEVTSKEILYTFSNQIFELFKNSNYLIGIINIFEIKLLYLLGVSPSMKMCPVCSKKLIYGSLSVKNGGFLCENCVNQYHPELDINESLLFKKIYVTKIDKVDEEVLKEFSSCKNIQSVIDYYYQYHLEFNSKVKKVDRDLGFLSN